MLDLFLIFGIVLNNSVSFYMWNMKVYQNVKIKKWRVYTGKRRLPEMPTYPYNRKNLFKNTIYEYAPIKEFKKEFKLYEDFEILQIAGYQSFELLWKLGLHKLSICAKYFTKKGCFQKRFGVPKSFLKFMVENNIDYEQYRRLKLLQETDINLINKYLYYDYNYLALMNKQGYLRNIEILDRFYWNKEQIREICKYVPLRKFLNYEKGVKNIELYIDYLSCLKTLNYKMKSKKELFPKQLNGMHNRLMKKIEIMDDLKTKYGVYLRFLKLAKYIYDDGKYIIFPATSVEAMRDEGEQQNNCVARLYLKPYIENETEIFFIRKLNNVNKSLITLEYKNNRVKQKELANRSFKFTKEQLNFINKWLEYRQFIDLKEKVKEKEKAKTNIKFKNYNISKLAA